MYALNDQIDSFMGFNAMFNNVDIRNRKTHSIICHLARAGASDPQSYRSPVKRSAQDWMQRGSRLGVCPEIS